MEYTLSKGAKVGDFILTDLGWEKVAHKNETGVITVAGMHIEFGNKILGWKAGK